MDDTLACSAERCTTTAPRPANTQWAPLWDAGWRWLATLDLYTCPACPPAVTITPDGRHSLGPGA